MVRKASEQGPSETLTDDKSDASQDHGDGVERGLSDGEGRAVMAVPQTADPG